MLRLFNAVCIEDPDMMKDVRGITDLSTRIITSYQNPQDEPISNESGVSWGTRLEIVAHNDA